MTLLLISLMVLTLAVLFLLLAIIRHWTARELTRTLAGSWTWDFGLSEEGRPTVVLKLWPADVTSKNLLLTISGMQVAHSADGSALLLVSERQGSLKVNYSRMVFVSKEKKRYAEVVPAGHGTGR